MSPCRGTEAGAGRPPADRTDNPFPAFGRTGRATPFAKTGRRLRPAGRPRRRAPRRPGPGGQMESRKSGRWFFGPPRTLSMALPGRARGAQGWNFSSRAPFSTVAGRIAAGDAAPCVSGWVRGKVHHGLTRRLQPRDSRSCKHSWALGIRRVTR